MQNNESRGKKPKQTAHIKWSCHAARLARGETRFVKPSALVLQKIRKLISDRDCRQNNFPDHRMNEE